jgi:hypothetical protein
MMSGARLKHVRRGITEDLEEVHQDADERVTVTSLIREKLIHNGVRKLVENERSRLRPLRKHDGCAFLNIIGDLLAGRWLHDGMPSNPIHVTRFVRYALESGACSGDAEL